MIDIINILNELDTKSFLVLNELHNNFWDFVMYWVSYKYTWIPLYIWLIWIVIREFKYKSIIIILTIIVIITASDQGSVHLFKNNFERLRPCHEPDLAGIVHTVKDKCGGSFGFISSHASNVFALAVFLTPFIRRRYRFFPLFIFSWAVIVSYSRIYLGVHYPGDIIGGAIFGAIIGYFGKSFFKV